MSAPEKFPQLETRLLEQVTFAQNQNYQAYQTLRFAFTLLPLVIGTDKFFHVLTNWDQYLAPFVPRLLHVSGHTYMLFAGAFELFVAVGMILKPRVFSYVVSAWLLGIVTNLLLTGRYFDIAMRDFGLFLASLALARLSPQFDWLLQRKRAFHREVVTRKGADIRIVPR